MYNCEGGTPVHAPSDTLRGRTCRRSSGVVQTRHRKGVADLGSYHLRSVGARSQLQRPLLRPRAKKQKRQSRQRRPRLHMSRFCAA